MSQGHGSPLSPHPVTSGVAGNRLRGRKGPDASGRGTAGPPAGVTRPHRGSGSDHLGSAGCSSKPRSDKGRVHPRQRVPSSAPRPHPQASTQTLRGRPPGKPGCGRPSGGGLTAEGRGITRRLARSRASWAGPVAAGVHTVSLRGTGGGGETLARPGRLRASSVTPGPGGWIWE